MRVLSIYRGARISAFKCRDVTRAIQGMPIGKAVSLLTVTPRKSARLVLKTLKSAIANAENNNNLHLESLIVEEAVVGEGPTFKRFRPKARGSAGPIRKRTAHIKIVLTDDAAGGPQNARRRLATRASGNDGKGKMVKSNQVARRERKEEEK